jgi:hypothetical protein
MCARIGVPHIQLAVSAETGIGRTTYIVVRCTFNPRCQRGMQSGRFPCLRVPQGRVRHGHKTCWPGSSGTNRRSRTSSSTMAATISLPNWRAWRNPRGISNGDHLGRWGRSLPRGRYRRARRTVQRASSRPRRLRSSTYFSVSISPTGPPGSRRCAVVVVQADQRGGGRDRRRGERVGPEAGQLKARCLARAWRGCAAWPRPREGPRPHHRLLEGLVLECRAPMVVGTVFCSFFWPLATSNSPPTAAPVQTV